MGTYEQLAAAPFQVKLRNRLWNCCGWKGAGVGAYAMEYPNSVRALLPGALPQRNCSGVGTSGIQYGGLPAQVVQIRTHLLSLPRLLATLTP